jgi:Ala-tRNA(Pro) deacylase
MEGKERLEGYLRDNGVAYEAHHHPEAFTAQEVAAAEHVPGKMLAKVVAVTAGDQTVMSVVPAPNQVDLDAVAAAAGAESARIATEDEFGPLFPDCDTGAMPPFGNGTLYESPVYVDRTLSEQEKIAFAACTHSDTIHMSYADFERLVNPTVAQLAAEER